MQNFFYLQETLVFNKTVASIQESDARRRLTSSIPGMSSPSFLLGSTTTPVPFSPPTIILEPTSSPKDHCSGDDHRVPVWTSSSEVGHDISEGFHELPETNFAKEPKDEISELTEEEHEEMSGWLEVYLLTDLKGKMKHKATKVREKRTRKTLKRNTKLSPTRLSLTILRSKSWRQITHFFRRCSSALIGVTRRSRRCPKTFGVCQPPVVHHLLRRVPSLRENHPLLPRSQNCVEV